MPLCTMSTRPELWDLVSGKKTWRNRVKRVKLNLTTAKSASRHAHVCINQLPLTYLLVWMYKMRCCTDNQVGGRFVDLKAGYISRTG
ncbi:hypothetical protein TWF225_011819 [Orbilia oligospora]|nr:hypothetical protein TWF751_008248 [Orbilia oligospora]KAF3168278.1 hypothetical protein TWF225_011819 [Orbilia oligospora]KAF3232975.1 hypothetical protein TWF128_003468 [Orbilia oligospora]KAF3235655.1 hypothetical protein TWF217_002896 [Orbilia oligospora]